ncbi:MULTISPECIES: XrtA/PEP-CTERM system histidine kinase PrsK [Sphingomonas]|uniref:histidine kinase n=1 Tax=Edaphosphingomonas fennica TaxID=114404 RepID=A0A2T4HQ37_9SPHN|nr:MULTISPECIES: XrtA/PEP-CTERM system histidine kinase PrsK [Sphingomonas]AGH48153.1 multi-sensor signal transduction histidine kinase [Sphingomonas sp. MM-1]MDX3886032.1 PEP-CTERM system histidine kinase PrsK [Sphingomonas sp.]PTD17895.1 PEP-CTERM system histidine kinase PrsK [Sphingomonas fennica]
MIDAVGVWGHGIAAALFMALALWQVWRPRGGMQRRALMAAFALTSVWAAAVALMGPGSQAASIGETARNLAWLGFMFGLLRLGTGLAMRSAIIGLYGVLVGVGCAQILVDLLVGHLVPSSPTTAAALFFAVLLLRMSFAVGALVLVHNLYTAATPDARWGIRLPMIALAAMWIYDLNLYTVAYLGQSWPIPLYEGRGIIMPLLTPLFALASRRNTRWRMRISRAVTFQSLSLMAIGFYLIAMVIVARLIELIGGDYAQLAQVTVVFGMSVAAIVFLPIGRIRAWLKVKIAKHLFQHRYDYRVEWMRFTDTIGRPEEGADPLDVRVIQAIADIMEAPAGMLLGPDGSGGLMLVAQWNWPTMDVPSVAADAAFVRLVEASGRILDFEDVRAHPDGEEAATMPEWILAEQRAWAGVPLIHYDQLVGIVLLARPRVERGLDWEDFDLLRVAGRQVASYLAEARGQEALNEVRRFDEFNRRFAFIMHDIKNLVSQLSLLTRNAERHADNPDFRADMIATLRSSTAKMNDLLARLSQHNTGRPAEPRPVALRALAEGVVASRAHQHPVRVEGSEEIVAAADPPRLEQALGHIVQNAIDVSQPGEPVWLHIERRGLEAVISVVDRGQGMSAEFVRTRLYKPFASTKPGGFGIGAFEARSLIAAMGGRLEVESREGAGTRFSIVLPVMQITARPDRFVNALEPS